MIDAPMPLHMLFRRPDACVGMKRLADVERPKQALVSWTSQLKNTMLMHSRSWAAVYGVLVPLR